MSQPTGSIPIILYPHKCRHDQDTVNRIVSLLETGYTKYTGERPGYDQVRAWTGSLTALLDELKGLRYPIIIEYPILGGLDRIDFIIVGSGRALIVEAKGWRSVKTRSELHVVADGKIEVNPCYQLNSYYAKMTYLHSASRILSFDAIVYSYNSNIPWTSLNCKVVPRNGLREVVKALPLGADTDSYVSAIVDGQLELSSDLVTSLSKALEKGVDNVATELVSQGYGLVGIQAKLVADILSALEAGQSGLFYLVEGTSGSGKTLMALTLFLEAISRGYTALLGYVNNRLVNILRNTLVSSLGNRGHALSKLLGYSAVGARKSAGFCEARHDYGKYGGRVDLLILDEAQRLPQWAVKTCPSRPARIIVAFYDDQQILLGREAGTSENLKKSAIYAGRRVKEYALPRPVRVPADHIRAVRGLLWNNTFPPSSIEVKVFDKVTDLLDRLREKYRRGNTIALICAFTESEGDRGNKLSWASVKNIRIGYPLQSGFSLYKDLNIKIKWLMDEKKEYPLYWRRDYAGLAKLYGMSQFDPVSVCSSVYGAQGMEAEYVGIVWGRDLVWRNGRWTVNPDPITDNVGGKKSLKNLAKNNPQVALELLRNRYYIMLTRATKGIYLFFEDNETEHYVKQLLTKSGVL
ncbi:MAG: DUF2075 domain-containing protein [Crenarchaeota archaeon]|nr:DUF2075 domain-containing protein [Thermoproteota archaeon]